MTEAAFQEARKIMSKAGKFRTGKNIWRKNVRIVFLKCIQMTPKHQQQTCYIVGAIIGIMVFGLIVSCKEQTKEHPYNRDSIIAAIRTEFALRNFNTITSLQSTQPRKRYFLVSCSTGLRDENSESIFGDTWFETNGGFPSKKDIDSMVYSWLPKKRKCYADVIIKSIYEFNNEADYLDFGRDFKSNVNHKVSKVKKCCEPKSNQLIWYNDQIPVVGDTTTEVFKYCDSIWHPIGDTGDIWILDTSKTIYIQAVNPAYDTTKRK